MKDALRFETVLAKTGGKTTGIVVPPEIMTRLAAGARPAVVASVNGYTYRTTVGVMGGKSMLPFSAQHREASGLQGGDAIRVDLQVDRVPRTVTIPADLEEALATVPGLREAFLGQAPSSQKMDIERLGGAKAAETRARRVAAIVSRLRS